MHASTLLLVGTLLSCLPTAAEPMATVQATGSASVIRPHFPVPSEGLVIPAPEEGAVGLTQLVDEFIRVTGQNVIVTHETMTQLQKKTTGLSGRVEVPPEAVYSFFEGILRAHDFMLLDIRNGAPTLIQIVSLETQERNSVRRGAITVPAERLPAYAEHHALLITTVLELPHTDVRTLSNSLRTMLTDANTQQIIPVGNSNSLILTGTASQVAAFAGMLRLVDEQAAKYAAEQQPEQPDWKVETSPEEGE